MLVPPQKDDLEVEAADDGVTGSATLKSLLMSSMFAAQACTTVCGLLHPATPCS